MDGHQGAKGGGGGVMGPIDPKGLGGWGPHQLGLPVPMNFVFT